MGPDSAAATEKPAMKIAVALPRWPAGTQRAKWKMTAGKNPASAAPSRKRST